jgi:hypothetical protein
LGRAQIFPPLFYLLLFFKSGISNLERASLRALFFELLFKLFFKLFFAGTSFFMGPKLFSSLKEKLAFFFSGCLKLFCFTTVWLLVFFSCFFSPSLSTQPGRDFFSAHLAVFLSCFFFCLSDWYFFSIH